MTTTPHHACITRRTLMGAIGVAAVGGIAGCLGDDEVDPDPIALDDGQSCIVCGMEIAAHHGPAVQAFFDEPVVDDPPAAFDSVAELAVYVREEESRGNEVVEAYATDYAAVDYELEAVDGDRYISTHAARSDVASVSGLEFVVGSEVHGAMGEDAIPFGDSDAAAAFADEHGGEVLDWSETVSALDMHGH